MVAQKQLVQLKPRGSDDHEENLECVELSEGERRKKEERRAAKLEIRAKRVQLETINRRLSHADFLPQLAIWSTTSYSLFLRLCIGQVP